jgi:hypothetical protein
VRRSPCGQVVLKLSSYETKQTEHYVSARPIIMCMRPNERPFFGPWPIWNAQGVLLTGTVMQEIGPTYQTGPCVAHDWLPRKGFLAKKLPFGIPARTEILHGTMFNAGQKLAREERPNRLFFVDMPGRAPRRYCFARGGKSGRRGETHYS